MANPNESTLDTNAVLQYLTSQLQSFGETITKFQGQIDAINSRIPTPALSENEATATPETTDNEAKPSSPALTRSEKFPDPPMFNGTRKDLRPFVTKLRLKLSVNKDRFPTEESQVSYGIARLDGDAARTMDPFFRNGTFNTFDRFISLLERTYDDASREHTAATKLENLRQRNREFTNFFSEFLGLVGELNWNESARIAALRRALSDEIRAQLVGRDLPDSLTDFATICQRIDEDLRYNRQARSLKPSVPRFPNATNTTKYDPAAKTRIPVSDLMDLDTARSHSYAPAGSEERKTRISKGECFGCGQRGHIQRHCPIRPFEKVRALASATNTNPNSRITREPSPASFHESENGSS
jgi:retrotransposon gag protein